MDSPAEARDYDAMDHADVNRQFTSDLVAAVQSTGDRSASASEFLDLGTGTARIPIEICRLLPRAKIVAVDAAESMLDVAHQNVAAAGLEDRIRLERADVKALPFPSGSWGVVVCNSLVHHMAEPSQLLAESVRVTAPGGRLFMRDLFRPADEAELARLVDLHAAGATAEQRQLLAESLRAALTVSEMREFVDRFGYDVATVTATSDRHWTWSATKQQT